MSTLTNAALITESNNSTPLEAHEKMMAFNPEEHYETITPLSKKALHRKALEKILITKQEKKIFFNKEDVWRKEFSPSSNNSSSSWWLEDNSYGSALITFIKDLSLIQFLRQTSGNTNDLIQINKYIKQQDYNIVQNKISLVPQKTTLAHDYISLTELWHEYANTAIFILILMTGIRMLMPTIYQLLTFKKKRRRRRNNAIIKTAPGNDKKNVPTILLTGHGRALKGSQHIIETEECQRSSRHHHSPHSHRRHRPKRSLLRKCIDFF